MDEPARAPSTAILTVPNLLTFLRLGLLAPFLVFALTRDRLDVALLIALTGLITDLVDGKIARRYGQISRLGIVLDPLADRLAVAAGAVAIIWHELAPLWAVLVVIGRDALLVLVGAPWLKARGKEIPPVSQVGKMGSFLTSVAFGLFIGSAWFDVADPIEGVRIAAWIAYAIGTPLYLLAALGYARAGWQGEG